MYKIKLVELPKCIHSFKMEETYYFNNGHIASIKEAKLLVEHQDSRYQNKLDSMKRLEV